MRSKTLYKIETKEVKYDKSKSSRQVAEELLTDHKIKSSERHKEKLSSWICGHNYGKLNGKDLPGSLLVDANIEIEVPATKNNILFIISDGQIMNQDLLKSVDVKINKSREQQTASCFNFANGGVRYDFEIREHRGKKRVMFRKDYGGWTEFSKGRFVHLNGKWDDKVNLKTVNGQVTGIIEREASFEEAGIEITKVAACNSRAICYGKERGKNGRHRFFWAQLADSFPDEPFGVKLPGVYVTSADATSKLDREQDEIDQEAYYRYEYVMYLYQNDMLRHPAWVMQVVGGKMNNIMYDLKNSIRGSEKFELRKQLQEELDKLGELANEIMTEAEKKVLKGYNSIPEDFREYLDDYLKQVKSGGEYVKKSVKKGVEVTVDSVETIVREIVETFETLFFEDKRVKAIKAVIDKLLAELQNMQGAAVMPVVVDNERWYEISLPFPENIDIDTVLDIGVSDIERYEHYKTEHGGEVQCWLYNQKLENFKPKTSILDIPAILSWNPLKKLSSRVQKELFNAVINHIAPNLKVHDGMGFNDGTCNFFFLAKTAENGDFQNDFQYSLFWCDEQEGFSEQWRNIHPDDRDYKSPIGMLSIFPSINWYYNKFCKFFFVPDIYTKDDKIKQFYDNFKAALPYKGIDEESRMAVAKNPILFTSKECIHSISYMWGVTDFRWNKRDYPEEGIVFPSSIGIRDDNTIYLMGFYYDSDCDEYISGYFFQKYIPQSLYKKNLAVDNYSAAEFEHKWHFVSDDCFKTMDRYYNFAIYDAYDEDKRVHDGYKPLRPLSTERSYCYKGVEERAQGYYVNRVGKGESMDRLKEIVKAGTGVWHSVNEVPPVNPFYQTIDPHQEVIKDKKRRDLELSIKLSLRWDNVNQKVIALFTNPCDDDIPFHMDHDKRLSEWIPSAFGKKINKFIKVLRDNVSPLDWILGQTSDKGIQYYNYINYDLSGRWKCDEAEFELNFSYIIFDNRVRCYSSPAVKKVELKYIDEFYVSVTIYSYDVSLRYVSIGAIVGGKARRISKRYVLSKSDVEEDIRKKNKLELTIALLSNRELGIYGDDSVIDREEYFYRHGQIKCGTTIWFEDILGHKGTAEEFVIKGKYWKTLGKVYFNPDTTNYRGTREEGYLDEDREEKQKQEEMIKQIREEVLKLINTELTLNEGKSSIKVEVVGHCASINEPDNEQVLSEQRSIKVLNEIEGYFKGNCKPGSYKPEQFSFSGRGAKDPARSNSTAEGMRDNRRVVVKVLVDDE